MNESKKTLFVDFFASTDREVVLKFRDFCSRLIEQHSPDVLYLAFSSHGGDNSNAFYLYNFLRSLPCELVTHCTSVAGSSGLTLFLAADTRYACSASRFLIHGPIWTYDGRHQVSIPKMREHLGILQRDEDAHKRIMLERTTATQAQLDDFHLHGANLTAEQARDCGFVHDIRPFTRPKGVPIFGFTT